MLTCYGVGHFFFFFSFLLWCLFFFFLFSTRALDHKYTLREGCAAFETTSVTTYCENNAERSPHNKDPERAPGQKHTRWKPWHNSSREAQQRDAVFSHNIFHSFNIIFIDLIILFTLPIIYLLNGNLAFPLAFAASTTEVLDQWNRSASHSSMTPLPNYMTGWPCQLIARVLALIILQKTIKSRNNNDRSSWRQ